MMMLTTLYRIPRASLLSIEPDQDYLEQFPLLEIEGVDSGYWPLLATELGLDDVVEGGDPLTIDETSGVAMVEWSPTFATQFCLAVPETVAAAIESLDKRNCYPGHDVAIVSEAVEQLRQFLSETDGKREALVEFMTF